jgi:glycosyltransferase involved in cell wall biosynthesis
MWDVRTSNGVDQFIAISDFIAKRIYKTYRRKSTVIYPPVDVDSFSLCERKEDYYVTSSRMVPYKKIDLIVESFNKMPDKRLIVIGDGPDYQKIAAKATNNIELLGYQPFDVLLEHLQHAKAFVFAAEEDFGIAPIEAQACGTPVIAYGKGGALETVVDNKSKEPTGIFFYEQTIDSICDAIIEFENSIELFTPSNCRLNALRFANQRFRDEFVQFVENACKNFFGISPLNQDRGS